MNLADRVQGAQFSAETDEQQLKRRILRDADLPCGRSSPGSYGGWCDDCFRVQARRTRTEENLIDQLKFVLAHS